jgi:hypothetical protein
MPSHNCYIDMVYKNKKSNLIDIYVAYSSPEAFCEREAKITDFLYIIIIIIILLIIRVMKIKF